MQAREKSLKQFVLLRKLQHGNATLRLCTWRRCVFFASVDATLDQEAGNNRNCCPFRLRIYQKLEQTSRPAAETRCDPSSGAASSSAGTPRANHSYRKKPWGTGRLSLGIGRKGHCANLSRLPIVWRRRSGEAASGGAPGIKHANPIRAGNPRPALSVAAPGERSTRDESGQ